MEKYKAFESRIFILFVCFCLDSARRECGIRRHGPGTIFMAVCNNVVRAKGISAVPQMLSLQVLQRRIENKLWTIMQCTRSQMRRDNPFYPQLPWAFIVGVGGRQGLQETCYSVRFRDTPFDKGQKTKQVLLWFPCQWNRSVQRTDHLCQKVRKLMRWGKKLCFSWDPFWIQNDVRDVCVRVSVCVWCLWHVSVLQNFFG